MLVVFNGSIYVSFTRTRIHCFFSERVLNRCHSWWTGGRQLWSAPLFAACWCVSLYKAHVMKPVFGLRINRHSAK